MSNVMVFVFGVILTLVVSGALLFNGIYEVKNTKAKKQLAEVETLNIDGIKFRDLNKNGKLDVYEDNRQDIEARISDLLSQMLIEEKVGLMWHPPI
jgi:beta-glucosidase